MSEIRTTGSDPYIEDSNNEVDKLQYAVLLTTTEDNSILGDTKIARGNDDNFPTNNIGPVIQDGTETQSLIDAIFADIADSSAYPDRAAIEQFLVGGTATVTKYGKDANTPEADLVDTKDQFCGFGADQFFNCFERTVTTTLPAATLDSPVVVASSLDISGVSNSAGVTGTVSTSVSVTADAAFASINNLVNDASNLSGQKVNILVEFAETKPSQNVSPGSTLQTTEDKVLPAINEAYLTAVEGKNKSQATLEELWIRALGNWSISQVATNPDGSPNPNFDAALADADGREAALYRLNTIPVLSGDKILVHDTIADEFILDPNSQVNLLEAVWTNWKNTVELNTDVYGISALTVPGLTATSFIPDLSGKSIIENMNDMYLTLSACCNKEIDLAELPSLTGIYLSLSALSAADEAMGSNIEVNQLDIIDLRSQIADLSGQVGTVDLGTQLNSDAADLLQRVADLSDSFTDLATLSAEVDLITVTLEEFDIEIDDLLECCDTNAQSIVDLATRLDNLDPSSLNNIASVFEGIDFNTYVTRLSEVETSIQNLNEIQNHIDDISTNTTLICSLCDQVVFNAGEIQNLLASVPNIDTTELQNLVQSINNLQDIQTVLDDLSASDRFADLEACCDTNATNLLTFGDDITTNTSNIQNLVTDVTSLCDKMENPTGVVKTTTNQTVSGEKTFMSTFTVETSSYLNDTVTVGDVTQPKIFDVCSTNGITTVNIANLPVSSNGLNPGDLYVTEIDGKKVLAIV